ncbi:uncharacterized protein MONOS_16885 [Monocercomonoides exilis]|uniref:uncharacterized protein n=1 Tax=Monocercomonoides exilis TaxID=2049356 RepID=UPI003559A2DD|nr:hypothetical protein MONOS_16885 [Monocercomonoides exilis]
MRKYAQEALIIDCPNLYGEGSWPVCFMIIAYLACLLLGSTQLIFEFSQKSSQKSWIKILILIFLLVSCLMNNFVAFVPLPFSIVSGMITCEIMPGFFRFWLWSLLFFWIGNATILAHLKKKWIKRFLSLTVVAFVILTFFGSVISSLRSAVSMSKTWILIRILFDLIFHAIMLVLSIAMTISFVIIRKRILQTEYRFLSDRLCAFYVMLIVLDCAFILFVIHNSIQLFGIHLLFNFHNPGIIECRNNENNCYKPILQSSLLEVLFTPFPMIAFLSTFMYFAVKSIRLRPVVSAIPQPENILLSNTHNCSDYVSLNSLEQPHVSVNFEDSYQHSPNKKVTSTPIQRHYRPHQHSHKHRHSRQTGLSSRTSTAPATYSSL